jgi:hypothetical protein
MPRRKLGEILVTAGVLDPGGLSAALAEQRRWGGPLGRLLVDMHLVSESVLVKALSHQLNIPVVDLDRREIPASVLDLVAGELAEELGVVPFDLQGKFLDVATSEPTNLGVIDELRIRTRLTVRPHLAGPKAIERALAKHYRRGAGMLEHPSIRRSATGLSPAVTFGQGQVAAPIAASVDAEPPRAVHVRPHLEGGARAAAPSDEERTYEIQVLQARIAELEALVSRDEDVLRKVLGLLVEKGVATHEEILERLR